MKKKHFLRLLLPGLIAIIASLGLVGCESDTVAPNDEEPVIEITEGVAAQQIGILAMGLNDIAPVLVTPAGKSFPYDFTGDIEGTVNIEYRTGGAGGTICSYGECDYGSLTTGMEPVVFLDVVSLTLGLTAIIDPVADSAVIDGTGNLTSGQASIDFLLDDVGVSAVDHLNGGTLGISYPNENLEVSVAFNGTDEVLIYINGVGAFELNLDTGETVAVQ